MSLLAAQRRNNYTFIDSGDFSATVHSANSTRRKILVLVITCLCIVALIALLVPVILDDHEETSEVAKPSVPLEKVINSSSPVENQLYLKFVTLETHLQRSSTENPSLLFLIKDNEIDEAFVKGQKDLKKLDQLNNALKHQGITLPNRCPALNHQLLSERKHSITRNLTRTALLLEKATKHLKDKFLLNPVQIAVELPQIDLGKHKIELPITKCNLRSKYRTMDGSCNNVENPSWGKANTVFARLLPSDYADGLSEPRASSERSPLPSARLVSSNIHTYAVDPDPIASHLMMVWGQLLDHDITKSAVAKAAGKAITCCDEVVRHNPSLVHPECLPIDIPSTDPFYLPFKQMCMEFVRSDPGPRRANSLGPREQLNFITAFIDGSVVYGSSHEEMKNLRTFQNGMLRVHEANNLEMLPLNASDPCSRPLEKKLCYQAGDSRVNVVITQTVMQTVLLREHNRIVSRLAEMNPHWNDDKLFQEGRKIMGAVMQHISFNEFLPPLLGSQVMKTFHLELHKTGYYNKYNHSISPSISNVFSAAAFRFGHSMAQGLLELKSFREIEVKQLHNFLFNPFQLEEDGFLDKIVKGAMHQPAKHIDRLITSQLTNHLFEGPSSKFGLDLAAIDIQRGRDHGIPTYNKWRKFCGLKSFKGFVDLKQIMDSDVVAEFQNLYKSVDDIDLFPAGLSEKRMEGSMLGPTFTCLIAEQFFRLRRGDRFWYERGGQPHSFTPAQLQAIRHSSLARMLCDNTGMTYSTVKPMLQKSTRNPKVSCRSRQIPVLDLKEWYEEIGS